LIDYNVAQDRVQAPVGNYTKKEVHIKMRDGATLFTAIYTPKTSLKISYHNATYTQLRLMEQPSLKEHWSQRNHDEEGYIIVYQDVRGRWMSDGLYDNMRAFIPNKKEKLRLTKHQILMIPLTGW
jgi:predicted acyl esterase